LIDGLEFYPKATSVDDGYINTDTFVSIRGRQIGNSGNRQIFIDVARNGVYYEYVCQGVNSHKVIKGFFKVKQDKLYKERELK